LSLRVGRQIAKLSPGLIEVFTAVTEQALCIRTVALSQDCSSLFDARIRKVDPQLLPTHRRGKSKPDLFSSDPY
jgi:hypothetical protein